MVTKADIEAKARELTEAIQETKDAAKNTAVLAGVAVIVAVGIAFWMGRRRGTAGKTVVEVYRVK